MIDYVPLGSIVLLEGGIQKAIIISRGMNLARNGKVYFFDYAGVPYPEGLTGDQVAYFNHENIAKVVFRGYHDDDDEAMVNNINRYLEEHPETVRGNADVLADK